MWRVREGRDSERGDGAVGVLEGRETARRGPLPPTIFAKVTTPTESVNLWMQRAHRATSGSKVDGFSWETAHCGPLHPMVYRKNSLVKCITLL